MSYAFFGYRNKGVLLRIIIVAKIVQISFFYLVDGSLEQVLDRLIVSAPFFDLALFICVFAFFVLTHYFYNLGRIFFVFYFFLTPVLIAYCIVVIHEYHGLYADLPSIGFVFASSLSVTFVVYIYLDWRRMSLMPSLAASRLQALQSRIRPHFLFNCINSAVSVVRSNPIEAERVLLNLADLFRAQLRNAKEVTSMAEEIELAKAYLDLERVRLGDRLCVAWEIHGNVKSIRVPTLLLQPLVENAVYHGIEPLQDSGLVKISIAASNGLLSITVINSLSPEARMRTGNKIALDNIRERLELLYDAEASMKYEAKRDQFIVVVKLPISDV